MEKHDINFCAVDFETATNTRMACQVAITIVESGEIKDTIVRYIQPPGNRYDANTCRVHHITPDMTNDAPTFDVVWKDISRFFTNYVLVAHNADFDKDVLMKNLEYYNIKPEVIAPFVCTYKMYKMSLADLCKAFGMDCGNHHDAGFDSRCCAQFLLNAADGIEPDMTKVPEKKKSNLRAQKSLKGDILVKDLSQADPANPFYDRKVVITGGFYISRSELAEKLKAMGADINTTISKKTHFVVIGEAPGPAKMEKLDELINDGYLIKKIYYADLENIFAGNWDGYHVDKE